MKAIWAACPPFSFGEWPASGDGKHAGQVARQEKAGLGFS